jgi:hypothetical protein
MNPPPDHEKSAMMQMILEFQGREIQLRAALSRVQFDLNASNSELETTKAKLLETKAAQPASETENAPP